jgi:hypothetical protein
MTSPGLTSEALDLRGQVANRVVSSSGEVSTSSRRDATGRGRRRDRLCRVAFDVPNTGHLEGAAEKDVSRRLLSRLINNEVLSSGSALFRDLLREPVGQF